MKKWQATHQAILDQAVGLASLKGLESLSLGHLAEKLDLSKSGLFAHFKSKTKLQLEVLDAAARRFSERVIRPALQAPVGLPRLRALFRKYMEWTKSDDLPGGCLFVNLAVELDDKPGAVRDRLVRFQRHWMGVIEGMVRSAVREGHLRGDLDPAQFAQDLYGIRLAEHHFSRLLRDPRAEKRAYAAFENLLKASLRKQQN